MIDLHMHSVYSDGSDTIEEILKKCEEKGLKYISITDHNNCSAYYDEAFIKNKIFSGKIIKGCELGLNFQNKTIEILGYNIDTDVIMEWRENYHSVQKQKENNEKIYNKFLKILDKKGIIYNQNDIRTLNEGEFIEVAIFREIIKHEENRNILGEEYFDYDSWVKFYRCELTNPKSEYFLNRISFFPKAEEVIDIIHQAGGKAFLAHPFEYGFENTLEFIDNLRKEKELDGIECFHPSSEGDNKIQILLEYANKNKLLVSGGSDYHGELKPYIDIAVGKGTLEISEKIIQNWAF